MWREKDDWEYDEEIKRSEKIKKIMADRTYPKIIIQTKDGFKFWTDKYNYEGDLVVFKTETKDGRAWINRVNKSEIVSITEQQI